jgi:hypothetical protein
MAWSKYENALVGAELRRGERLRLDVSLFTLRALAAFALFVVVALSRTSVSRSSSSLSLT